MQDRSKVRVKSLKEFQEETIAEIAGEGGEEVSQEPEAGWVVPEGAKGKGAKAAKAPRKGKPLWARRTGEPQAPGEGVGAEPGGDDSPVVPAGRAAKAKGQPLWKRRKPEPSGDTSVTDTAAEPPEQPAPKPKGKHKPLWGKKAVDTGKPVSGAGEGAGALVGPEGGGAPQPSEGAWGGPSMEAVRASQAAAEAAAERAASRRKGEPLWKKFGRKGAKEIAEEAVSPGVPEGVATAEGVQGVEDAAQGGVPVSPVEEGGAEDSGEQGKPASVHRGEKGPKALWLKILSLFEGKGVEKRLARDPLTQVAKKKAKKKRKRGRQDQEEREVVDIDWESPVSMLGEDLEIPGALELEDCDRFGSLGQAVSAMASGALVFDRRKLQGMELLGAAITDAVGRGARVRVVAPGPAWREVVKASGGALWRFPFEWRGDPSFAMPQAPVVSIDVGALIPTPERFREALGQVVASLLAEVEHGLEEGEVIWLFDEPWLLFGSLRRVGEKPRKPLPILLPGMPGPEPEPEEDEAADEYAAVWMPEALEAALRGDRDRGVSVWSLWDGLQDVDVAGRGGRAFWVSAPAKVFFRDAHLDVRSAYTEAEFLPALQGLGGFGQRPFLVVSPEGTLVGDLGPRPKDEGGNGQDRDSAVEDLGGSVGGEVEESVPSAGPGAAAQELPSWEAKGPEVSVPAGDAAGAEGADAGGVAGEGSEAGSGLAGGDVEPEGVLGPEAWVDHAPMVLPDIVWESPGSEAGGVAAVSVADTPPEMVEGADAVVFGAEGGEVLEPGGVLEVPEEVRADVEAQEGGRLPEG